MLQTRVAAVVAAVAVAAGSRAFAANHIVEIQWGSDRHFQHQVQVAASKFVEVCGKLAVGDIIRWSYEASATMDFNIHYHVGKDVVFPAKQQQVSAGRDTLVVTVAQDYCWMWSNKSDKAVNLSISLRR